MATGAEADWAGYFDSRVPLLDNLLEEALHILRSELEEDGIKVHSVEGRVKAKKSFLEKIERKGYMTPDTQVQDLVGVRVVTLFLDDLPQVEDIILTTFDVIDSDDKVEGGAPDSFGYMSKHYICQLPYNLSGPRYNKVIGQPFEIQVRTILMDAWANVSHHLAYKGEASLPDELQRDFHALSGLFYVADKHFQMFSKTSEKLEEVATTEVNDEDPFSLPVDRPHVAAMLRKLFPERERADLDDVSSLVEQLASAGYKSIGAVIDEVLRRLPDMLQNEKHNPPIERGSNEPTKYTDLGAVRAALGLGRVLLGEDMVPLSEKVRKSPPSKS